MCVAWFGGKTRAIRVSRPKEHQMALPELTPQLALLEEALTILFCRIDDAYYLLNPKGRNYETLKELSDSEVISLALFQQLRGVESERSFLREVERFFWHLFPGAVGLHPSSLHRRVRKLRRYFEPLRRTILPELVGDPETLIVDSTLLGVLHPREVSQSGGWGSSSAGAAWVRWGSFSVYGVKLHLLCATNRVPISYELTPANTADLSLAEELVSEANLGGEETAWGLGLPKRRARGGVDRVGDRGGHQRSQRQTAWCPPADRDRLLES